MEKTEMSAKERAKFVKHGKEGVKASIAKYGEDAHKIFGKLGAKKRWEKKKDLSTV